MKTVADLHTHITDHWDITCGNGYRFFGLFNNPSDIPDRILAKCRYVQNEARANTLAAVINFNDNRTEELFNTIEQFADSQNNGRSVQFERKNGVLSINFGGFNYYFIQGREIRTKKGDILIVGNGRDIASTDSEYVFKAAREEGDALVLIPHLGASFIGMDLATVKKYAQFIDAVDGEGYAEILQLPNFAASDSHTINHMFSDAQMVCRFSLDNPIGSLREGLKSSSEYYQGHPKPGIYEMARHLTSSICAGYLLKSGILKRR